MTTDFRALCAELVDIITAHANPDDYAVGYVAGVLTRARAALALADGPAVPEGREPVAVTGQPARLRNCPTHGQQPPEAWGCPECVMELRKELTALRQQQPLPPADGEVAELVAELVAQLQEDAYDYECIGEKDSAAKCNRAADLLQRLIPLQPVSERPPEDQLCWWFEPDEEDEAYGSSWTLLRIRGGTSSYTHCLPAHALPIPQQQENYQ